MERAYNEGTKPYFRADRVSSNNDLPEILAILQSAFLKDLFSRERPVT